jgi:hypothetical protein
MTCRSGRSRIAFGGALLAAAVATGGCNYTFSGGGGLPSHVKTVYVPPVENNTTQFALTETLTQGLLDAARERLGVQLASEQDADATIEAALTRYEDSAINFAGVEEVGAAVFQRRVSITARVDIIDNAANEVIWSGSSVTGVGEYTPATETEALGQEIALENLIQKIVDGAQSQW